MKIFTLPGQDLGPFGQTVGLFGSTNGILPPGGGPMQNVNSGMYTGQEYGVIDPSWMLASYTNSALFNNGASIDYASGITPVGGSHPTFQNGQVQMLLAALKAAIDSGFLPTGAPGSGAGLPGFGAFGY